MNQIFVDSPITTVPCQHLIKIKAKFVSVPLLNENGYLQLNKRGQSVPVKSVTYCNNPCCERVFDYEPIDGRRVKKFEVFSSWVVDQN